MNDLNKRDIIFFNILPALFIVLFLIAPVLYLMIQVLVNPLEYMEYIYIKFPPDGVFIDIYRFNDRLVISIQGYDFGPLLNSLILAATVSTISTAIGVVTSLTVLIIQKYRVVYGYILPLAASIPAPLLSAYAVLNIFHRDFGIVNRFLNYLGVGYSVALEGIAGVALYQILNFIPLVHLMLYTYYESIDRSLIDSALNLSSSGFTVIRRILIPLSRPAIIAVFSLIFVLSLEDLAGPIAFSRYNSARNLLPYLAYMDFVSEYGYTVTPRSIVYTSLLVIIATVVFISAWRYLRIHQYPIASVSKIYIEVSKPIKAVLLIFSSSVLLFSLSVPVLVLIYSVTYGFFTAQSVVFKGLDNYVTVLMNPYYRFSMFNTIVYTVAAVSIMMLVGVLASYSSLRLRSRIASLIEVLSLIPIVIPGIAVGIGYFMLFHSIFRDVPMLDPIAFPQIYLVLAYASRRFPYMFRPLSIAVQKIPYSLEEAAYTLGAERLLSVRKIILPLSIRGLVSGSILSSLHVSTEFSTSVVLVGGVGVADVHPAPIVSIMLNALIYNPLAVHTMSALLILTIISSVALSVVLTNSIARILWKKL